MVHLYLKRHELLVDFLDVGSVVRLLNVLQYALFQHFAWVCLEWLCRGERQKANSRYFGGWSGSAHDDAGISRVANTPTQV